MLKKTMTRSTIFFLLIPILATTIALGQSDTTYYPDKTGFSFQRNDTTFNYHHGRLIIASINLLKGEVKSINYYPSGKIESIAFTQPNKAKNGYEYYGKWLGFYENGIIRFKVLHAKNGRRKLSYFYFPNGKVQCKTYWNKHNHGEKKRQICYDEKGNKTNDVKKFGANDVRVDECNCDN